MSPSKNVCCTFKHLVPSVCVMSIPGQSSLSPPRLKILMIRWYAPPPTPSSPNIKSKTHRNVELESQVQSFHHHPRLFGYFLVQLPRRRPSYRHRRDRRDIFSSPDLSRCPQQYLQNGLLFHDDCFDAGCQQFLLDAGYQQVGSSSRIRHLIHWLYRVLDLGWCRSILWVGTCRPHCYGFHGWLWGMFGSSYHLRSLVPS
jgi:hypothetical protein